MDLRDEEAAAAKATGAMRRASGMLAHRGQPALAPLWREGGPQPVRVQQQHRWSRIATHSLTQMMMPQLRGVDASASWGRKECIMIAKEQWID